MKGFENQISYFLPQWAGGKEVPGSIPHENIAYGDYFSGIKNGRWKKQVNAYRTGEIDKCAVPGITPAGTFSKRNKDGLKDLAGVLALDFDNDDQNVFPLDRVRADKYVWAVHKSVSGKPNRYVVYVRIEADEKNYLGTFRALEAYFLKTYRLICDPSCKDLPRYRFVSWDPNIHINSEAETWTEKLKPESKEALPKQERDEQTESYWSDFNAKTDIRELLEDYGWTFASENAERIYMKRPDLGQATTATQSGNIHKTKKLFHVETSATCLPENSGLSAAHIWCYYEHGDLEQGKKALKKAYDGKAKLVSGNIFISKGCYCLRKMKTVEGEEGEENKTTASYSPISNFILKSVCLIRGQKSKRIIEIIGAGGQRRIVEATMADLNSPTAFYSLMESQGNFVSHLPSRGLFNIKRSIFKKEISADRVEIIGHHENGKVYVFGNGVFNYSDQRFYPVDQYGVCPVGEDHYYIPAFSLTNNERLLHKSMQDYYYKPDGASFREIAASFYQVFGDNGRIGIAFVLSALFSDIIFETCGNFPILFAYGVKGSGKTSFAEKLASVFKKDAAALNIEKGGSSAVGANRALSQVRNGLVPMDEFKIDAKREMIGFIKRIYDRIGRVTGRYTGNQETRIDEVLSAAVICGEHLPENNAALFSRLIHLNFFASSYTPAQKDAFDQLTDLLRDNNGAALAEALRYRKLFETEYRKTFKTVRTEMRKDERTERLSERDLQKLSQLAATLRLLENTELLPGEVDRTISFLIGAIVRQGKAIENTNEVAEFWNVFSELADEGEFDLTEKDEMSGRPEYYYIDEPDDVIVLNLRPIIGAVRERAKRRDYSILYVPVHTLVDYLKKSAAYKPNDKARDGRYNMKYGKKGYGFSYSAIKKSLGEASEETEQNPSADPEKELLLF